MGWFYLSWDLRVFADQLSQTPDWSLLVQICTHLTAATAAPVILSCPLSAEKRRVVLTTSCVKSRLFCLSRVPAQTAHCVYSPHKSGSPRLGLLSSSASVFEGLARSPLAQCLTLFAPGRCGSFLSRSVGIHCTAPWTSGQQLLH